LSRQPTRAGAAARSEPYTPKSARRSPGASQARRPEKRRGRKKPARRRGFVAMLMGGIVRLAIAIGIVAGVLFASLDGSRAAQEEQAFTPTRPVWLIDIDGDGLADLANPTRNEVRGPDLYGSGSFGAARDGGKRKHEGTDYIAAPGAAVRAPMSGKVIATGSAYGDDPYLRFIEISDPARRIRARLFYVQPGVAVGKMVKAGDIIGAAQSLDRRYPLISNHVHVEIRDARGAFLDPGAVLPPSHIPLEIAPANAEAPHARVQAHGRVSGVLPAS
jgi:murein DD-endopeptidase MepM/ murein hydrolase activator NlpD